MLFSVLVDNDPADMFGGALLYFMKESKGGDCEENLEKGNRSA